ncbi:MAG: insulinase family protein, partial [Gammaproteobacteria bacterium]
MSVKSLLLFLFLLPFAAQAGPRIEHWQTANGAEVYFVAAPELPIVDVQVVFDAGSARAGNTPGVALLTAGLLSDGAQTANGELGSDEIAERFAGLGALFGASADRDMATVSLRSLTDTKLLQPALDTLALLLSQPTFPAGSFERERKRMLIGLQAQEQSPADIAGKAFYTALYGNHPYATQPLGTVEGVNKLTRADVVAHH